MRRISAAAISLAAVAGCSGEQQPAEVARACEAIQEAQAYLSRWPGTDAGTSGGPARAIVFRWKGDGRYVMSNLSKYLPTDRLENAGAEADFAGSVSAFVQAANSEWTKPLDAQVQAPKPGPLVDRTCSD